MNKLGLVAVICAAMTFQAGAPTQTQTRTRTLDEKACAASGGHVERFGKAQAPSCVKPLRDAGKACAKKADCLGQCLADDGLSTGAGAKGHCQARDAPLFSCFTFLNGEGKAAALCVD